MRVSIAVIPIMASLYAPSLIDPILDKAKAEFSKDGGGRGSRGGRDSGGGSAGRGRGDAGILYQHLRKVEGR